MNSDNFVIVYGGSFNPPTIAHVILTQFIINEIKPKKLIVMPTFLPPHKEQSKLDENSRFELIYKTFNEVKGVEVSDLEYKLKGKSYTYKTLEVLRREYNDIYLAIGMDSFLSLPNWFNVDRILEISKVLVLKRGGYEFSTNDVFERYKNRFVFLDNPVLEISSSYVRDMIKEKKDFRFFVTDTTYKILHEFIDRGEYV